MDVAVEVAGQTFNEYSRTGLCLCEHSRSVSGIQSSEFYKLFFRIIPKENCCFAAGGISFWI